MKLSKNNFDKVTKFIYENARELDKKLYSFYFQDGSPGDVIEIIKKYQNSDGGFGHGLEPDFRTPSSSAIATSLAIQYMEKIGTSKENSVLKNALDYFSSSFSEEQGKWRPVPSDVNSFPHAPWWHLDEKTGLCVIDQSWENPTVEILGYLLQYPNNFSTSRLKELMLKTINMLLGYEKKMDSEHSLYCYLSFYSHASEETKIKIKSKLSDLILGTVNTNPSDWGTKYVPKPLQFVDNPDSPFYHLLAGPIDQNIDLLIKAIDFNEAWFPTWKWVGYEDEWQKARVEWAGKIAVENLAILKRFSKIEY